MTEEKKDSGGLIENRVAIQTLFSQLTRLVLSSAKSKVDITNLVVIIGNWVTILIASLIVMIEGKDQSKAFSSVDRITISLNNDIKKHVVMIRGLKNKADEAEEKKIIM